MSVQHNIAVLLADSRDDKGLQKRFQEEGYHVYLADSSEALYRLLNQRRCDAVVVANELDGFLSGIEILERLNDELLRPVTVLIADDPSSIQERASALKVDAVCTWHGVPHEVTDTIKAAFLTANYQGTLIPLAARRLVQETDEYIQPMPQLIVRLTQVLEDDKVTAGDVAKDISTDPRVTAELLRLINCPQFGLRSKITRVHDAVAYLGIRRTAALVMSLGVHKSIKSIGKLLDEQFLNWFRVRSVLMASVASTFAKRMHSVMPDTAHVLALLQDLGILVLAHGTHARYMELLHRYRSVPCFRLDACERLEFSFSHADVTAALLQKWELPVSLVRLTSSHHMQPNGKEFSKIDRELLHLMQLAESVAEMLDLPSPQRNQRFNELLRYYPQSERAAIKSCLASAVEATDEAGALFSVKLPDQQEWSTLLAEFELQIVDQSEDSSECSPATIQVDTTDKQASDPDHPSRHVLLVDDERAIGNLVKRYLQRTTLELVHWTTPQDLDQLPSNIEAVIVDVHLGATNGISFVRTLRSKGVKVPIFILSGDRTRSTVLDSIEAGITDYITKPFKRGELLSKLEKYNIIESVLETTA